MARKIHSRYKINGILTAMSPIHVGGLGGNVDTDLALAVNGKGDYYIPGTSLAGALRNWMEIIDIESTNFLWGPKDPNSDQGHASFILVEDAILKNNTNVSSEIRDNVAIDRHWGTAVDKMKFDRMILPRGTKIKLEITLERPVKINKNSALLKSEWIDLTDEQWHKYQSKFAQLLAALQNGQVSLGAAKTRGLGRVKLEDLKIKEQILHNQQGMLQTLLNGCSQVNWNNLISQNHVNSPAKIEIEIHWKPSNPVMVKAEGDGIAVDILPLVSGFNGGITFVLPGSSIKGAFRTQAERILRTVTQQETLRIDNNESQSFNDQIDIELVQTIFGSPAQFAPDQEQQLGYLGALSVDDCFAKIPLNKWSDVENSTDEKSLREALNDNNLNQTQQVFHVAIDRWTGGAADSFLYTVLEPMGFNWFPLNLSLDLRRLKKCSDPVIIFAFPILIESGLYRLASLLLQNQLKRKKYQCLTLLLLTLRDLMNERIPLGFGTNRGMGAIKIEKISFQGLGELKDLNSLKSLDLTKGDLSDIDDSLLATLDKNWQEWINYRRVN